jgi:spermidine synthase
LTAIEIDPEIVVIARKYFALPEDDERLRIVVADGVEFIHKQATPCDLIMSDAYGEKNCFIDALHDEAFYKACHRILRPSGVMTVNIFRPDANWGRGYLAMLNRVFAEVYYIKVEEDQFVMVLCKNKVSGRWPAILQAAKELDARKGLAQIGSASLVKQLQASLAIRRQAAAR